MILKIFKRYIKMEKHNKKFSKLKYNEIQSLELNKLLEYFETESMFIDHIKKLRLFLNIDFIKKINFIEETGPIVYREWKFLSEFYHKLEMKLSNDFSELCILPKEKIIVLYCMVLERQRLGGYLLDGEVTLTSSEYNSMNLNRFIRSYNNHTKDLINLEVRNCNFTDDYYIEIIIRLEENIGLLRELNIVISLYMNNEIELEFESITDNSIKSKCNSTCKDVYRSIQDKLIRKENTMYSTFARQLMQNDCNQLIKQGKTIPKNIQKHIIELTQASDTLHTIIDKYDKNKVLIDEEEVFTNSVMYYSIMNKYSNWNDVFVNSYINRLEDISPYSQNVWAKKVVQDSLLIFKEKEFISMVKKECFKRIGKVATKLKIYDLVYDWDNKDNELINKIDYPFIKIGDNIYINKSILYNINLADRWFSIFMESASKKSISSFSTEFEKSISEILSSYGFKSYFSKDVLIKDKKVGEFDFIGIDDKTLILGEIKISSFKNDFSQINTWSSTRIEGKASFQLEKLKSSLDDNKLKSFFEDLKIDYKNKDIVYIIYSCTPDGILLTENFISVNMYLFDEILSSYKTTEKSIFTIYQDIRNQTKLQKKENREIKVDDMSLFYESHY